MVECVLRLSFYLELNLLEGCHYLQRINLLRSTCNILEPCTPPIMEVQLWGKCSSPGRMRAQNKD